ncbi:MAG: hypothetical protein MI723_08490 [Caulobacterales bacterium]|nr:hypothetical protein [Caulobacterales bacterium]
MAANVCTSASPRASITIIPSVDMQIRPWFMTAPKAAARTASSRSTSRSFSSSAIDFGNMCAGMVIRQLKRRAFRAWAGAPREFARRHESGTPVGR